jgi:hypothetical protein
MYVDQLSNVGMKQSCYELPDGSSISLSAKSLTDIGESLFSGGGGSEFKGVQHMLMDVVNGNNPDLK